MVTVTCGGLVLDKIPSKAFKLFEEIVEEFRDDDRDILRQVLQFLLPP